MSEEKKNEVLGQEKELSMDELDAVAGGKQCVCVLGGGGEADSWSKTCWCVGGGGGENNDGSPRCACPLAGGGMA